MSSSLTASSSLRIAVTAVTAVAVAAALGSTSAHALTAEEILNYKGPDRQKVLEDGARKEGTVFIYSGMIVNQLLRPLTEAFEKKYPFIKTRYWRGDSNQVLFKVLSEMQANALEADIVEGSGIGAIAVAGSKIVLPFYSPMFEALPKEDIAPNRTWAATRFRYIGLGYNTNYISRDEAPKNYDDLQQADAMAGFATGFDKVIDLAQATIHASPNLKGFYRQATGSVPAALEKRPSFAAVCAGLQ